MVLTGKYTPLILIWRIYKWAEKDANMNKSYQNEKGSVLVLAIIIIFIFNMLIVTIISVARMESLMGVNTTKTFQVQQVADAGVEWAMEKIYLLLEAGEDPLDWGGGIILLDDLAGAQANVTMIPEETVITSNAQIYSLTSTGEFAGLDKTIKVKIKYSLPLNRSKVYIDYYQYQYQ